MKKDRITKKISLFYLLLISVLFSFFCLSCAGMAASAEEYYSIGMAFYDLGKFEDAEKWLSRARQADRTYVASQYNLGRIAFERKRFSDAAGLFEGILKKDPDNLLALRAAAYTRIKMGDIERAQRHYSKLLELVPESADDGYNHALVLFAMNRFEESEETLNRFPFALSDNKDMQLLRARSQGKQNKVEAIDSFAAWLSVNSDNKARYEYAHVLEHHEFYARALEELRKALEDAPAVSADPAKNEIRFAIARVLLIAETSNEGITEMQGAVNDGFNNIEAIEKLITSDKISAANRNSLRDIADNMRRAVIAAEEEAESEETQEEENTDEI